MLRSFAIRSGTVLSLTLVACLLAAGVAQATPLTSESMPTLAVTSDGETQGVPLVLNEEGTGFDIDPAYQDVTFANGDSITLMDANGMFDPVLNLAVGVTDSGAPSNFFVQVTAPLVPTLFGIVNYRIDLGGFFTDGASDGGSITAFNQSFGVMDVSLNGTDIDGVGTNAVFPAFAGAYGPFLKLGQYDCGVVGCSSFDINFQFTGSGNNDTYTLNGRFEVVPEPTSALLLGVGTAGLALRRRKLAA